MPKKIYVTDKLSPKVIHDNVGYLCTFINTKDNIIAMNEGLEKNDKMPNIWFVVLTDEEKIKRMESLKGFGTIIKEQSSEPIIGQTLNLRTAVPGGVNEAQIRQQANKEAELKYKTDQDQMKKDVTRYGELFAIVGKNGGGTIKGAEPALVQEFKDLKEKLGIKEKELENEENT